jgi:hypothetical protein
LIAFLLLDHPKFGYLCWDMLWYPCLLSPSSLIFVVSFWICSGLSQAMWARLAAFLADLWVLTMVSQLVLPWCSKKPIYPLVI